MKGQTYKRCKCPAGDLAGPAERSETADATKAPGTTVMTSPQVPTVAAGRYAGASAQRRRRALP